MALMAVRFDTTYTGTRRSLDCLVIFSPKSLNIPDMVFRIFLSLSDRALVTAGPRTLSLGGPIKRSMTASTSPLAMRTLMTGIDFML
jgi:hypothetical protein